ncbi:MAG: hypothetical protein AVDCRST_MAG65-606, partial [uncultured Solirubrobacteraceae bacterium]
GEQDGPEQDHLEQAGQAVVAVGHPAAVPGADGEGDEHDADRVGPDDRRGAEVRREQPRGGDLGTQGRHADDEDDERQRRAEAGAVHPWCNV